MGYTRLPPVSGAGAIVSLPTTSPIPVSDPNTTNYHFIPGLTGIQNQPPAAIVPTLAVSDATQASGTYVVGDDLVFVTSTSDTTDFLTTTSVDIYESGVLVGSANQSFPYTWYYTVLGVTAGAKSYVARRVYGGGSVDSAASTLTVQDLKAPDAITSATLAAWWRSPESLQYGGTPLASGTTPPAVTLTGTLTGQPYGWQMSIPVGGARGTATYSISHDNGSTVAQTGTTAATVADGATGITVNFPVGTYNSNNLYKGVINQWNDKVASNTLANAIPPQRPFPISGQINNVTAVRYDASDDRHNCTTSLANDVAGGADTAHSAALFTKVNAMPGAGVEYCLYRFGVAGGAPCGGELKIVGGTTAKWAYVRRNDAGTAITRTSNIPATLGPHILIVRFDGTNVIVSDNGADVIGGGSDVSGAIAVGGTCTLSNLSVGAEVATITTSFASIDLYEMSVFTGSISAAEAQELLEYF